MYITFFVCLGLKRVEKTFGDPPKKYEFLGKNMNFCLKIFTLLKCHSPTC